jgi:hypothetical protein
MTHGDNKAANNRLICKQEGVTAEGKCTLPYMMIQDAGASFGRSWDLLGIVASYKKAEYAAWVGQPIWKNHDSCQVHLPSRASLRHPKISEEGRLLLHGLMSQLSREQIVDLFEASRVEERGETYEFAEGERAVTVEDWADAFEAKVQEIGRPCQPKE